MTNFVLNYISKRHHTTSKIQIMANSTSVANAESGKCISKHVRYTVNGSTLKLNLSPSFQITR